MPYKCSQYNVTITVTCLLSALRTLYTLYTKLCLCKDEAIPLQAWTGSEGSRSMSSGVPRNFVRGGVQQIQLRTEDRENGDLGVVTP
jgi:hypothetical protein